MSKKTRRKADKQERNPRQVYERIRALLPQLGLPAYGELGFEYQDALRRAVSGE